YIVLIMVVIGTVGKLLAGYIVGIGLRFPLSYGHMMFGLTSAHAAGSIAIVMVGRNLQIADGVYLVDNEMLNGVVMMILFTCIISSVMTELACRQIVLHNPVESEIGKSGDDEKILLALRNEETMRELLGLAIMMRNPKLNRGLVGLNVVLDDMNVAMNQAKGKALLEKAQKAASAADVRMQTQSRIATNIANGMIHAFKEYDASEIIIGQHVKKTEGENFWGLFTENLTTELNRQIIIARVTQPLNTIRRIQVVVPSRAEYEPGFHRWLDRLARMASNLECRMQFHCKPATLSLINQYIQNIYPHVRAEYTAMTHWNEVPKIMGNVKDDHLLVIITARKGTISYKSVFEKLPQEISQYYKKENLMIIFPDQYGEPVNMMTFAAPQKNEQLSAYTQIHDWITYHARRLKKMVGNS
ncbi:MAG: cation:proton antiporter, partial [Prevotella sp.]|nr:cation:proton antiporter [Prevotella sp.]